MSARSIFLVAILARAPRFSDAAFALPAEGATRVVVTVAP